ncbi:MAG: pyridoxamine 5'-phosphate oxidase family protein [Candidatus Methylomirabilales bacterium]|nr:pyridoxamine 5'-phosphate oxidase family protein [candidate division NC10 bacterium]
MKHPISEIAFTPVVKAAQEKRGSRNSYAKMEQRGEQGPWRDVVTAELAQYIAERDSLYLGTAGADGQPYIQYRGGPKGFLKVLDEHTLALADFAGNAQYISLGNLGENNKAFIFLMDYPNRHRIKIWGTAEFIEDDAELLQRVVDADYKARPERVLCFHVKAWSPNCTQHIKQRFTAEEMVPRVQKLQQCIAELEETIASLRKQLGEAAPEPAPSVPSAQLIASLITETPPEGPGCGLR